ncbi:Hint domain-containing protein, partial [Acetobacter sp. DmW_125133]
MTAVPEHGSITVAPGSTDTVSLDGQGATVTIQLSEENPVNITVTGNIGYNNTNALLFEGSSSAVLAPLNSWLVYSTATNTTIISVRDNNWNTIAQITITGDIYNLTENNLSHGTYPDGSHKYSSNFNVLATLESNGEYRVVCFLVGSMIRTPDGDVAVEDIQIGDEVIAFDWRNNKNITRPVVWVGKTRAAVRPELSDDEAGWPVRILKGAIADGVPYKDMLITAEHCLFFKDSFVPVRMLVNGV